MVNPETKIVPISSQEAYKAIIAQFEKRKQEILASTQRPTSASLFLEKLFKTKNSPSMEEQLTQLETEFRNQIFSQRQMVVCHLKANPENQEKIIAEYLQSPELLKDIKTLGQFFSFWLLEFFQKANTGPIENLYQFIKNSGQKSLPWELHQARREIFEPISALLNGKEKEVFKNINELNIFGVGQKLAELLTKTNQPFPNGLKKEYQKYVNQLIRIESGIIPVSPAEPEPKKPKPKKPKEKAAPTFISPPLETKIQTPPCEKIPSFSFWIILGPKSEPIKIESLEELTSYVKKIKGLGPISPEDIWQRLLEISLTAQDIDLFTKRYKERVAGGKFKGWYECRIGKQWLTIFKLEEQKIIFRVGSHEDVYATKRRKPPDRARSL